MKQPRDAAFQAAWFALHLQAAILAQIAVFMHVGSALYHWQRIAPDHSPDATKMVDETAERADAFVRGHR